MTRRQYSEDNIVQMLDGCDLSDLEDVLSEFDDEFIPQGDASESEDNLEVMERHVTTVHLVRTAHCTANCMLLTLQEIRRETATAA
jgi:hypothetical protein